MTALYTIIFKQKSLIMLNMITNHKQENKTRSGVQFLLSLVSIGHWSASKRQVFNHSSLFTLVLPFFLKITLCFTRRFFGNNYQLNCGDQLVHKIEKQTFYHCNSYMFISGDGLLLIAQNSLR